MKGVLLKITAGNKGIRSDPKSLAAFGPGDARR